MVTAAGVERRRAQEVEEAAAEPVVEEAEARDEAAEDLRADRDLLPAGLRGEDEEAEDGVPHLAQVVERVDQRDRVDQREDRGEHDEEAEDEADDELEAEEALERAAVKLERVLDGHGGAAVVRWR